MSTALSMSDINSQTLHVVAKEMSVTLADARVSLEAYSERLDQRELLEKCAEQLHAAQGVLHLVEVYGAALLAEEMELVARYLLQTDSNEKRHTDGLDSLMRAMVQLPTYLDRVLSGGRDMALILLPLLNDLRAVRGTPLLSEGTLLLLNLKSDQPAQPQPQPANEPAMDALTVARRLRSKFQVGLLGLIRNEVLEHNLGLMAQVAAKLEQVATTQPVFQFWWVTGAVIEALQTNGIEASATVKRLLGQADRQIKLLGDLGEARYSENPPVEILNNLLYCVACSSTDGGRIGVVRKSFKLSEVLPFDDAIEQERASLSAPSVKLMHTVAVAIKEDLAKVKDVLDIFVRRGGGQTEELRTQLELLRKISDTLGVLGLGQLRQRVQDEIAELNKYLSGGRQPPEGALIKIAGVLLSVEDNLDEHLVRLILPLPAAADKTAQPGSDDHEFRQVSEAVLRECVVNLARVKDAVSATVQNTGESTPAGLDAVPQLLRGITAGLLMLGKGRAVGLMDAVGVQVRRLIEIGAPKPDAQRLERIADAIVSLEYYMETIQSGRADPWYMLDNAEICIKALQEEAPSPVPTIEAPAPADLVATVKILEAMPAEAPEVVHPPTVVLPAMGSAGEPADPQMIEVFCEEAKEVVASISKAFPVWKQNPDDTESLSTIRRNFHTLKGSGRMVGARLISDFAWAIENLLNRLLDKTLPRTAGMTSLVGGAVSALPHLVDHLETGRPVQAPIGDIMANAYAFAEGRRPEQRAPAEEAAPPYTPTLVIANAKAAVEAPPAAPTAVPVLKPAIPQQAPAAVPKPAPMDPVLHEIYSKETAAHLEQIRAYLSKRNGLPAPHDLTEAVYRAIHTLSGSSKMADARHGIRITEPLNQYMRKVFDSGRGLPDTGLVLLSDVVAAIENVVSHIDEETDFFGEQPQLRERIATLEAALDGEIARAAEESAASERLSSTGASLPAEPAAPQVAASEAFDTEIANIYSDEAMELLDAAQVSLAAWNANPSDRLPIAELQRQLHTLKGGARMAGIAAMGDLSHELETLVMQIDTGAVIGGDRALAIVQASLDELAHMRDTVAKGSLPNPASPLIGQIRTYTAGGEPLDATPVPPALPVTITAPPARPQPLTPPVQEAPAPLVASIDELETSRSGEYLSISTESLHETVLPGRERQPVERAELARVDADLLDTMLNNAGEVSIFRARLDQQINSIDFNLAELARTVTRLKEQLRGLEIETEVQVLNRHRSEDSVHSEFDPLELDRYSSIQQFSRALAETSGDVASIQGLLESLAHDAQNLLAQQARVITELQNSLMRTRMVPFQRHVQRLTRLVRQVASDTGKHAELIVQGGAAELDRQSLERMVAPLEHMLRNAIVHGIERPERRAEIGKPTSGRITISLTRDGAEVIIVVSDDGAGIDVKLIREKAISLGLADPQAKLTDEEAMQLILEPGFSTAGRVTQSAGRGVGMDVVATEVKKLGGGLFIESKLGEGSRFTIRLPFTLAISQALIVRVAEEIYALPLATVEGVVRLPRNIVARHLSKEAPPFEYGGQKFRFQQLGTFVGIGATMLPETDVSMSVVLIKAGEHSTALVTDELIGSREIVVKSLGPQISAIRGIAGATILGDGRIVVILDMGSLVRSEWRSRASDTPPLDQRDRRTFAMVVDDSITVRRVTQRLLERNGMKVLTAKDGVEAMSLLQDNLPEVILLDIEMPRMDGYEVAAHVRGDPRLKHIPIVMITSRVSEKHRARAIELGVNAYLGKPYQESQLLDAIEPLVQRRSAVNN